MMLSIIVLSVVLSARFIQLLDEAISKTLIFILCIPVMLVFAGLMHLCGIVCTRVGITNESVQIIIGLCVIASLTFSTDKGLQKIYRK